MKRAIILVPNFNNMNRIKRIREQYDPLANYIAPHITVVFPFDSEISTEELSVQFKQALKGVKKFQVQLSGFTGDFRDGYLFLNVKWGNDSIIELHDKLYSGILESFLFRKITYCPHLTVGRLQQSAEFDKAMDELACYGESFEAITDKIYVENLDEMEHSMTEFSFDLE